MSEGFGATEDDATRRIGDQEREAATTALIAHREAGRLDSEEYEDRQVRVARSRTWLDIQPLFDDLPQPHPVGMPPAVPGARPLVQPEPGPVAPSPVTDEMVGGGQRSGLLGDLVPDRYKATVMALTPFVALLLFFVTPGRGWLWFLAIPIMGVLLYGPDGEDPRKRQERLDRDERRRRRREDRRRPGSC